MIRLALLLVVASLGAATPALAQPLARVSGGDIPVRAGPGAQYAVIGRLPNGTRVPLDYCTPRDRSWCFVTDTGWVDASWIVGSAAKIRATPPRFAAPLGRDGRDLFGPRGNRPWPW